MTTLASQIAELERDARAMRLALLKLFETDRDARLQMPDYRDSPDFETLREAIQNCRRAFMGEA